MDPAPTQYIDRDGAALAYQVIGHGPVDIVHFLEISQHLDPMWTDPDIHHNFEHVSRVARNVFLQRRGIGLSDQVPYVPTLEQQADDVIAVMDAVGVRSATLVSWFTTCGAMALVAAREPERVDNLVLIDPLAQGPEASGLLHGWTDAERRNAVETLEHVVAAWGSGVLMDVFDPVMNTAVVRLRTRVLRSHRRRCASGDALKVGDGGVRCHDQAAACEPLERCHGGPIWEVPEGGDFPHFRRVPYAGQVGGIPGQPLGTRPHHGGNPVSDWMSVCTRARLPREPICMCPPGSMATRGRPSNIHAGGDAGRSAPIYSHRVTSLCFGH